MGRPKLTVFMFHRLSTTLPADPTEQIYTLAPSSFEQCLDLMDQRVTSVVGLSSLKTNSYPDGAAMLSFDDGCDSDLDIALPQLRRFEFPAVFFVSPALLGSDGYLSWDGVEELVEAGMDVGSHGLDHTWLWHSSEGDIEYQLAASKDLLEQRLDITVDTIALPGGKGGERTERIARKLGYRVVFGSRPGLVTGGVGSKILPRVTVLRRDTLNAFRRYLEQDRNYLRRQRMRYAFKETLRFLLGQSRYERLAARAIRAIPAGEVP